MIHAGHDPNALMPPAVLQFVPLAFAAAASKYPETQHPGTSLTLSVPFLPVRLQSAAAV